MIDSLIRWSLHNRTFVLMAGLALVVVGGWRAERMPVDVFPDLTAPTVTVITEAHGMAPVDVERMLTRPVETALNGTPGLRRLRSSSGVGISVVWAEFNWGDDPFRARQLVSERLQLVTPQLPRDVELPILAPITSIMGTISFVALSSDVHDAMQLREEADWTVRRRLLATPGVAQVVPIGGDTRQLQLVLAPDRMAAFDLSLDDVVAHLQKASVSASTGFVVEAGEELLIHGYGRVQHERDLQMTVVGERGGRPVLVRDVGDVLWGPALKRGTAAYNGKPAVVLAIQKQPSANTLKLSAEIDDVIVALQSELPTGMKLHNDIFQQADFIEAAVDNVSDALRDGALLVVLILLLFLGQLRPTLISALAIPISLVATALVLDQLGMTLNTMTLGGMAIAVGALVDDAIIDVENVVRRLRENAGRPIDKRRPLLDVIFDASKEIRTSIVMATLIIMVVFLPLFFLSGIEGRLLVPLGISYLVALGVSLVVALTVTPALCFVLLPGGLERHAEQARLVTWLQRRFAPVLQWSLRRPTTLAAASALALLAALASMVNVGQAFLPEFNEGGLTISVTLPPGTSLADSDRIAAQVDAIVLALPEVNAVGRRTGRAELDEHAQGVNASELELKLHLKDRTFEDVLRELREDLRQVPGVNIAIGQPISHRIDHMLSGTRSSVAVKVFGADLGTLYDVAEKVKAQMATVPGVVDLNFEVQPSIPIARVLLDRAAIAMHGLTPVDVTNAMKVAYAGVEVSTVYEDERRFDVVVKAYDSNSTNLAKLKGLTVRRPGGGVVPLQGLARVVRDTGPGRISRENVQRKVVVMCNVADVDVGTVVAGIQANVGSHVQLPDGVRIEYGGQFKSAQRAQKTLSWLVALVFLGVAALLWSALGSSRDAVLVLLNLPLALIGGLVGVHLTGGVVSVATLIGLIALFGVATRNGLMLVTHVQHLVAVEGVTDATKAVMRGAQERLSPVLMTALASALALVPMAWRAGETGAEIQAPMAMVMLCGLVTSTVLNMVVIPSLYLKYGSATRGLRDRR